jgi:plasmid stabilization system protein ParE
MVPVIYALEAERDLEAITAYIAKDNPKAAEQKCPKCRYVP